MMEPDIFFINIYMGLAYAIFYRKYQCSTVTMWSLLTNRFFLLVWFEAFPLVFADIYHMSPGVASLPFLGTVSRISLMLCIIVDASIL